MDEQTSKSSAKRVLFEEPYLASEHLMLERNVSHRFELTARRAD